MDSLMALTLAATLLAMGGQQTDAQPMPVGTCFVDCCCLTIWN